MITILSFVCKFVREREREREREKREALLKLRSPQNSQQSYNYIQFAHCLTHGPLKNKSILCVFNEFFKHQSYIQLAFSHNSIIREKRLQFNNHSWYKRRISDTGTIKQK